MNMKTTIKEYVEARQEWADARKNKTTADVNFEKARHRFNLARAELRAEESQLLEDIVQN